MLSSLLSLFMFNAAAVDIPKADYRRPELESYSLPTSDFRFPSGLRLLIQIDSSQPVIAITSVIDRGSEADPESLDGIAHVVEHLAFRANHNGIKNWDLVKQMGGVINASTTVDWTNYMTIAPKDALIPLMRLEVLRLKDGLANISERDVITESEIARNEKRMRYASSAAISAALDVIGEQLYPEGHPYSRTVIGTHETIGNISLESVKKFVEDNYKPELTTLMVVGDITEEKITSIVFEAFSGNEDLLMSTEDAAAYVALKTENDRIKFFNEWQSRLSAFMKSASVNEDGTAKDYPPRVDCSTRKEPPPPFDTSIKTIKGVTKNTTAVLGWSLPGGYCEDQYTMNMAASLLTNYIYSTLVPSWEYGKEDSSVEGIGCFPIAQEYSSMLLCYIEQGTGGYSAKRLIEKAQDALYLQTQRYDPNMVNTFEQWNFGQARSFEQIRLLGNVDAVSDLFSGRATETSMFTHFTGDPRYFSANINALNNVNPEAARKLAGKYITRERMVSLIVEPMDEEERMRMEAEANSGSRSGEINYHASDDEENYTSLIEYKKVTKELIDEQLVSPDLKPLHRFTLDNGLDVGILPYGEAPLVRVALKVNGNMSSAPRKGMNSFAQSMVMDAGNSRENLMQVAGSISGSDTSVQASGPSGNLDAILNKMRWSVEPTNFKWKNGFDRSRWIKNRAKSSKSRMASMEPWVSRTMYTHAMPGHPLGSFMSADDYIAMKEWTIDDAKHWIYSKWQPSNAELIIVGKVDPAEAEKLVHDYFDSWSYAGKKSATPIGYLPPLEEKAKAGIYVFDKPLASQTDINLACQLGTTDYAKDLASVQIVGDVLSEEVHRKLREEAGVTYGANAYARIWRGGAGALFMSSLVQNDATGFSVTAMLNIIKEANSGTIKEQSIADHKLSRARKYVLNQQTGSSMLRRLSSVGLSNLDFFDQYTASLGSVQQSVFPALLGSCQGNEVITVVGPIDNIKKELDDADLDFKEIQWEEHYIEMLTPKELKKYNKKKAKREKAKKKAEQKK